MDKRTDYEKPASFYLGRKYDLADRRELPDKFLYDANDLTTHGMCVGMTGSGKTGLCVALLEEAALDSIPVIAIDPKGDIGNVALAFPRLRPDDFAPWIDPQQAAAAGKTVQQYAADVAAMWKRGLAAYDQPPGRIQRFRESADVVIYTPGSEIGVPLTVLKDFGAPSAAVLEDVEIYRERLIGTTSGLLTLMGLDGDPLTSREHILISNILDASWRKGQGLTLPALIRLVQSPPMDKLGVFDLESFYPVDKRVALAMQMNNLLASPAFAGWMHGRPLKIDDLLYTPDGKPKISVLSIAHLDDQQRMFFVTLLLSELLGWMRAQSGTSSLRALLYMDEVYGFFPPTARPPCKPLMLTLLKQARAFGLGVLLATQNPVDLDYKGLANIGTWFIGRLQTERDKDRVMEGLEGVAAQSANDFSRSRMEQTLAGLGKRVFLMNNVHDEAHTVFHTRWVMSYLRGPLGRDEIRRLMQHRSDKYHDQHASAETARGSQPYSVEGGRRPQREVAANSSHTLAARPVIPPGIVERFLRPEVPCMPGAAVEFRPALVSVNSCHYVRVSARVDIWIDRTLIVHIEREVPAHPWDSAEVLPGANLAWDDEPLDGARFREPPAELLNARNYKKWEKQLREYLYREFPLEVFHCEELDVWSRPGESAREARVGWTQLIRQRRDIEREKILAKYAKKVKALEKRIRVARQRLQREQAQYEQARLTSMLSIGQTVLGALLGNKITSRAATVGRGLGRARQQKTDLLHAQESLEALQQELQSLDQACQQELDELGRRLSVQNITLTPLKIPCRKGDLRVELIGLLWFPWQVTAGGRAEPLVLTSPSSH